MRYKKLSINDAKLIIEQYDKMNDIEFEDLVSHWKKYDTIEVDHSYDEFRNKLLAAFQNALVETSGKMNYLLDLRVGLCLYQLMSIGNDFSIISANDDDIWRYISVKVMPDITYLRYPDPEKNIRESGGRINHKRFYLGTRRIWLKTLWWYVHLSWQGDEKRTFDVLKDNAIDNINKLIETPGKGYRISLYRNMMLEYSKISTRSTDMFLAMTKLNNVKCLSVEPELVAGGEREYARQLIKEVGENHANNES